MSRITDRRVGSGDWFEMWMLCRKSTIENMARNMASDLSCGYSYFGASIQKQKKEIESYEKAYNDILDMFKGMDEDMVDRWCFYDMKKRGDID